MKKILREFCLRGMVAAGFGPIVLGTIYFILYKLGLMESIPIPQLCIGIFSITALAFMAGGVNVIHYVEKIPLMVAILIQGLVLYGCYLVVYLINGWLIWGLTPVLVFTGIFALFYLIIWIVIYSLTRKNTAEVNEILKQKQQIQRG